jgi:hypothetical protein
MNEDRENLISQKEEMRTDNAKDIWASVLFLIFFLGYIGATAFVMRTVGVNAIPTNHVVGLLLSTMIAGFVLSVVYYMLMQKYPKGMITASFWISIGMQFVMVGVMALIYFRTKRIGYLVSAGIFLLIGFLLLWFYRYWKLRIPFAAVMLTTVMDITCRYPNTLAVALVGLLGNLAFGVYWTVSAVGLMTFIEERELSKGAMSAILIFAIFVFYWTTQVVQNTVHVTIAGLFGTFYFLGVSDEQGQVFVPVANPTLQSAKRAFTTSFGSICYGSLLIALIQTLRAIINMARASARESDNIFCVVVLCCVECFVAMIEELLEYFNKYAFTQVAIYGKNYCTAAKDTWELAKSRGLDAVINDNLIGNVLVLGSIFVGLITAVIGLLYVYMSDLPKTDVWYVSIGVVAFFVGMAEFSVFATVVDSGVCTTFVCLAEDPVCLARTKPELYQRVQETYPEVLFF